MASALLSLATAVPEHALDLPGTLAALSELWPHLSVAGRGDGGGRLNRFTAEPMERVMRPRGLGERMEAYARHGTRLAREATRGALARADLEPAQVDAIISVSCTGYLVPSLDAHLVAELGFRPDVLRLPITELGCSGGGAALAFAHRHLVAYPHQRVLVVAVELPSITFQAGDRSLDNLTASFVFGDGAGAALLTGARDGQAGLRIEAAASRLVPASTGVLGFDLRDGGFHVVLDRRLPRLIRSSLGPVVREFRASARLDEVAFVAAHGGGPRILDAVQDVLGLGDAELEVSRQVYERVGNVSSASILFTLEELAARLDGEPCQGLGLAFGPGVSIELMHLGWRPLRPTPV